MSDLKYKELMILGVLYHTETNGENLNQFLNLPTTHLKIGKKNAFDILTRLESQGFVLSEIIEKLDFDKRKNYKITDKGREEFFKLLKSKLAEARPNVFYNGIAFDFISLLSKNEIIQCLSDRIPSLEEELKNYKTFDKEVYDNHPGLDLRKRMLDAELSFTKEFINNLSKSS